MQLTFLKYLLWRWIRVNKSDWSTRQFYSGLGPVSPHIVYHSPLIKRQEDDKNDVVKYLTYIESLALANI